MNKVELIEDYIINVYLFSSNADGWCIHNKVTGRNIILQKLISEVERIFPNMGATNIVTKWWARNIVSTNERVKWFMSDYRLVLGNKMVKAWDIVNSGGKEFNFDDLLKYMPTHQHNEKIIELFDKWFDDKLLEANVKLFKGRK